MEKYIISLAIIALFLVSACSTGNVVANPQVEELNTGCTETDNGLDKANKGEIKGYTADGKYVEVADSCIPPFLVEYYCEDNVVKNKNIRCQICDRGACT
jgi:hypothetical protein